MGLNVGAEKAIIVDVGFWWGFWWGFLVEVEGVEERGGTILVGGVLSVCGGLYGLRPILGRTQVVCV